MYTSGHELILNSRDKSSHESSLWSKLNAFHLLDTTLRVCCIEPPTDDRHCPPPHAKLGPARAAELPNRTWSARTSGANRPAPDGPIDCSSPGAAPNAMARDLSRLLSAVRFASSSRWWPSTDEPTIPGIRLDFMAPYDSMLARRRLLSNDARRRFRRFFAICWPVATGSGSGTDHAAPTFLVFFACLFCVVSAALDAAPVVLLTAPVLLARDAAPTSHGGMGPLPSCSSCCHHAVALLPAEGCKSFVEFCSALPVPLPGSDRVQATMGFRPAGRPSDIAAVPSQGSRGDGRGSFKRFASEYAATLPCASIAFGEGWGSTCRGKYLAN